jgi:hypothetical protein
MPSANGFLRTFELACGTFLKACCIDPRYHSVSPASISGTSSQRSVTRLHQFRPPQNHQLRISSCLDFIDNLLQQSTCRTQTNDTGETPLPTLKQTANYLKVTANPAAEIKHTSIPSQCRSSPTASTLSLPLQHAPTLHPATPSPTHNPLPTPGPPIIQHTPPCLRAHLKSPPSLRDPSPVPSTSGKTPTHRPPHDIETRVRSQGTIKSYCQYLRLNFRLCH